MESQRSKILVIDDEAAVRGTVSLILANAGMESLEASSAHDAQAMMVKSTPDLVLLDWMLPGMSGLEYLRLLRRNNRELPVIMLTARSEEGDMVRGLDSGADDYIQKPFSSRALVARIHAVLRRADHTPDQEVVAHYGLELNESTYTISAKGRCLKLSPMEYRLLAFFITHPEKLYTRDQILDLVWGKNIFVGDRTVDVHIRQLRKSLEPSGLQGLIQTVRSAGYLFSSRTSP